MNALGRFRKKKPAAPARAAGCDPDVFAAEITAHLARAHEIRSRPVRKKRRVPPEIAPEQPVVEDPEPDVAMDPGQDPSSVRLQPYRPETPVLETPEPVFTMDRGQDPSSVRLQPDCDPVALLTDAVDQPVELQAEQP